MLFLSKIKLTSLRQQWHFVPEHILFKILILKTVRKIPSSVQSRITAKPQTNVQYFDYFFDQS